MDKSNAYSTFNRLFIEPPYSRIMAFYVIFGILYILGVYVHGSLSISFYIAEIGDSFETIEIPNNLIYFFVVLGGIFPAIAWKFHDYAKVTYNSHAEEIISGKKFYPLDLLYIFFLSFYIFGNAVHFLAGYYGNLVLYSYQLGETSFYHGLYFYDEYLGHALMVCCVLFMGCIDLRIILHTKEVYTYYPIAWLSVILVSLAMGIGFAITMCDGQANIPVFFAIILCFIPLIQVRVKKPFTPGQKVIFWFYFLMLIHYIITLIVLARIFGLKPHYPYFIQFSELGF